VAHLWSTADRWRREISGSRSSARTRNSKTLRITNENHIPKNSKSADYESGNRNSIASITDGDAGNDITGDEETGNDIEQLPVIPYVIETQTSPDHGGDSIE